MITIDLEPSLERRLKVLARKTGCTIDFHAREAILERLEDLEDAALAVERLGDPAKTFSSEEVKNELGLPV